MVTGSPLCPTPLKILLNETLHQKNIHPLFGVRVCESDSRDHTGNTSVKIVPKGAINSSLYC